MCGRYVIELTPHQIADFFAVDEIRLTFKPRFNVAPSTEIPVVARSPEAQRILTGMRWGLRPAWADPATSLPLMINARAETVATKPAYRAPFKSRRCLVPASGYYEWKRTPAPPKQPFYFTHRDGLPIAFAGIYEPATETSPPTVALLTTTPNAEAAAIHDRMPVLVEPADWPLWLQPSPLTPADQIRLLADAPAGTLSVIPVSTRVNSVRHDDASLISAVTHPIAAPELPPDDLFA